MNLAIPRGMVQTLAWGMIAMPFALPNIAWELGWVRPPETTPDRQARTIEDPVSTGEEVDSTRRTLEIPDATSTGVLTTEAPSASGGCAAGQIRGSDGHCVAKLKGDPVKESPYVHRIASCGDSVCEPARGESSRTCCEDCPCDAPLVCKRDVTGGRACQAKGLE
ncbi:hypothetical protein [Nannocystis sp. SCPEA4]|uniref:hypothetical protein n=1 Tax=Nannocystis sp. SCPEA4 TaxID=2996787 RepID=UPI002271C479|nr:hypothetical protein [Nannocystis sp. SCPEA4]MCY1055027.1 hypothetical protein [Nannocystis sp. SCPEA4]